MNATLPEYHRLPPPGERDPLTKLSRSGLRSFCELHGVRTVKSHGKRGPLLIRLDSLIDALSAAEDAGKGAK